MTFEADKDMIEGTHCPFGVGALAVPQQSLAGMSMAIVQHNPPCTKKCKFYDRANEDCTILLGLKKYLATP